MSPELERLVSLLVDAVDMSFGDRQMEVAVEGRS
jgi:hypothetical protein